MSLETPRSSYVDSANTPSLNVNSLVRPEKKVMGISAIAGTSILFTAGFVAEAQGTNPSIDPNCASLSPAASMTMESAIPSASAVVENPDGSIDVFIPSSAEPISSPLPSIEINAQAVGVDPSINPLPSPKKSPEPETVIIDPNCSTTPSSPNATKSITPVESLGTESPYTVDALLNANLGKITKSEVKKILKKASKETARYYKANGMVPDANPNEEYKYWNNIFKKALRNGDAEIYGNGYATQTVNMIRIVQKIAASGDLKASDAVMDIAEAFYRGGFSFFHTDNGQLLSKEKYDQWVKENAIDAEREFGIELIKN